MLSAHRCLLSIWLWDVARRERGEAHTCRGAEVQRCERTGQGNLEGLCELELWMEVDLGRWSVRSWPGEQWGKSNVGGVVRLGRTMERE